MTFTTDPQDRARFIAGLRELADFLEATPAAPVPRFGADIQISTLGSDEENRACVDRAAVAFASPPVARRDWYETSRRFQSVSLRVVAIPGVERDRYKAQRSYDQNILLTTGTAADEVENVREAA